MSCCFFFFSSRRRHTRSGGDWSSDVCSSDLIVRRVVVAIHATPDPEMWTLQIEWAGGERTQIALATQRGLRIALRRAHEAGRTLSDIAEDFRRRGFVTRRGPHAGT